MKSSDGSGNLIPISNYYIKVGNEKIEMRSLPDIPDSKSASYNDEAIAGRPSPMKTYSDSETRTISWTIHFAVVSQNDVFNNTRQLRLFESLVYPRSNAANTPFQPPIICSLKCGSQLADAELCAILRRYSLKIPTDVAWDERTLMPYKFDLDLEWEIVYDSGDLPGQDKIMRDGG